MPSRSELPGELSRKKFLHALHRLGFDGNKMLISDAAYGDNSPGPCWADEALAQKTLHYIDVSKPWLGEKVYTPSKKMHDMRMKAFDTCGNNPMGQ